MNYFIRIILLIIVFLAEYKFINAMEPSFLTADQIETAPPSNPFAIEDENKQECIICFNTCENEQYKRTLPCKHSYHKRCINKWLKISSTCPICNQKTQLSSSSLVYLKNEPSLLQAAQYGDISGVIFALNAGAEINTQDSYRNTALHIAAAEGHYNLVVLLISRNANIEIQDYYGYTPLHKAAVRGHYNIVSLLITNGANVGAKSTLGYTPLHKAAGKEYLEIVTLLLDNGANIDAQDSDGKTALHRAAQYGLDSIANLLVERGTNIFLHTTKNKTALDLALANGHVTIIQLLANAAAH